MFKKLIAFFRTPTIEEAYQNGRKTVDEHLAEAINKQDEANYLYAMASGGFNSKPPHYAFDRGVNDRLTELSYLHSTDPKEISND